MRRARTVKILFWACVVITAFAPFVLYAWLLQRDAGTNLTNATEPVADVSANIVAEGLGERVWLINPVWDGKKHYPGMRPNTKMKLHERAVRIVSATQQAREWFAANLVYSRVTSMKKENEYNVLLRMSSNPRLVKDHPKTFTGDLTSAAAMAPEMMSAKLSGSADLSVDPGGTVEVGRGQRATDFIVLFDPVWKWFVATLGTLWAFYLWVKKRKWRLEKEDGKEAGPPDGTGA
jgi:hypothetical protein